MEIELLTKKDLANLTDIMLRMQSEMENIKSIIAKNQDTTLGSAEICSRLRISYSTLMKRRAELSEFGMFNSGKMKMKASELDKYIEYKKNHSTKNLIQK